ncbi:MAG: S8 family serine peptidase, partial [Methylococcales bacterium]
PGGGGFFRSDSILSTINSGLTTPEDDDYGYSFGTSMAAPHVSGVAALMYALQPDITPTRVESILKATARSFTIPCLLCGAGRLNASAAVRNLNNSIPVTQPMPGHPNRYINHKNIHITDATQTGVKSVIRVNDRGNAQDVTLRVGVKHARIEDLSIRFIAPNGDFAVLKRVASPATTTSGYHKTFIYDVGDIPNNGDWKLHVIDVRRGVRGFIDYFRVDFD